MAKQTIEIEKLLLQSKSELGQEIQDDERRLREKKRKYKALTKAASALDSKQSTNDPVSSRSESCTIEDVYDILADLLPAVGGSIPVDQAKSEVVHRITAAGNAGAALRFSQAIKSKSNPFVIECDANGQPTTLSLPPAETQPVGPAKN